MGQRANSGRHASLDDKKRRAEGRQQNDPAQREINDRDGMPPVAGAFGAEGEANWAGAVRSATGDRKEVVEEPGRQGQRGDKPSTEESADDR
jgi:hypothetical protein